MIIFVFVFSQSIACFPLSFFTATSNPPAYLTQTNEQGTILDPDIFLFWRRNNKEESKQAEERSIFVKRGKRMEDGGGRLDKVDNLGVLQPRVRLCPLFTSVPRLLAMWHPWHSTPWQCWREGYFRWSGICKGSTNPFIQFTFEEICYLDTLS